MTSHGVPRAPIREDKSEEARQTEVKEIQIYQQLVQNVNTKMRVGASEYTPQLLQRTAELLKRNPEYYTIWNYRRRIYTHEFEELNRSAASGELAEDTRISNILDIIHLDLQFLFPLLLKFPKCYWIWNHRLWLLDQSTQLIPSAQSRALWLDELGLVGKMLSRDSRNFHGWGYRRVVIENLESSKLNGNSMAKQEFDYTTKLIRTNLSNFSAWHNRSKLILKILEEQNATDVERKAMFDEELNLIHKALFDPYDQSLWFYHQNLMCVCDPEQCEKTMAPHLSTKERQEYLATEKEFVEEILEDTTDCKWIYQALIELSRLKARLGLDASTREKDKLAEWIAQLKSLDPLRQGRWEDLERSLSNS